MNTSEDQVLIAYILDAIEKIEHLSTTPEFQDALRHNWEYMMLLSIVCKRLQNPLSAFRLASKMHYPPYPGNK